METTMKNFLVFFCLQIHCLRENVSSNDINVLKIEIDFYIFERYVKKNKHRAVNEARRTKIRQCI